MSGSTEVDTALYQLQTEQGSLLDKIDELRTIGVGGLVGLPQLIVCGNQSSGKSSVLQAISRVRFPVKSNVCTRFPTEVILRRHPESRFKVSIEPGSSRTSREARQAIQAFAPAEVTSSDQLESLVEKAKECIGITSEGFSDDILKVEILGPDKPELTLVDLPGLYTSHSTSQDEKGIMIVHDITKRYMRNQRSIILAVVSAKNDYHIQRVLNMAEEFDRSRERTIGIITQPDMLEAHSEEEASWLQILKNDKVPLKLGWHVLRNRSFETRKVSDEERDRKEKKFFAKGNWSCMKAECMGVERLRHRLSTVLLKHVQHNLPGLIAEINERVLDRQSRLAKLGPPRCTLQQQKGFLLDISSNFERITTQALNGMYDDDFFGEIDNRTEPLHQDLRRLRAIIRELNEYFVDAMETVGCSQFIAEQNAFLPQPILENPYSHINRPKYRTRPDVESDFSIQARQNRGIELPGSANQLLVGKLFREQSKPWEKIAREHLTNCWDSVRDFIGLLLQHLANKHTYSLLMTDFLDPGLEKMKDHLMAKLNELTAYNKRGHPLPLSKGFLARIQKARSERQFGRLERVLQSGSSKDGSTTTIERLRQADNELDLSNNQFAAADIVDQMQAYYDTAIITFVDNVATLGIENCLLGPLGSILTSQTINNMEDKQVQDLAAEPSFIADERAHLTWELEKLQAGSRTLSKFNIRKIAAKPTFINPTTQSNSVLASQAARASSGHNIFGSVPLGGPSPMKSSPVNLGTSSGIFGFPRDSQPSFSKAQSLSSESPILFSSDSGSLQKGKTSSSTSGSSLFSSVTVPSLIPSAFGVALPGNSPKPFYTSSGQSNSFSSLPPTVIQKQGESIVPVTQSDNSLQR
ncbi:hypothetical protein N7495_004228 [Penicillium taxi]|uniref:uncharacterized protein n=1 Tax=Penicillium taxi TaxID=168475 RepID=UPI002545B3E3|nr:uncharacterized protein N7495_004228 [Penicillium taxi]KAJ5899484.1 hypothetical protein N7495_004228 [Penicillium taxi]